MENEHPLIRAIQARDKAIKQKAHPKLIKKLERNVEKEARKTNDRIKGFEYIFKGILK